MKDGEWITKEGEKIPVSKMRRSHIEHSIAKIEREWPNWRRSWMERLRLELRLRDILGRKD